MSQDGSSTPDLGGLDDQQRLALEGIVAAAPVTSRYVPPTSEMERSLCAIWAKNMGVQEVGVTDDFFDLGGDSILAMAIAADAAEEGIVLPAESIFDRPTVVALASAAIRTVPTANQPEFEVEEENSGRGRESADSGSAGLFPVTRLQSRMAAATGIEPDAYVTRVGCVIVGPIDPHRFADAWQRVGAAVDSLRARFVRVDGEWKQYFPETPLDVRTLDRQPDMSTADWLARWRGQRKGFEGLNSSLLRVEIAPLEPDVIALAFTHHHLLLDGWSQQLLVELLESAYTDQSWLGGAVQDRYRQWLLDRDDSGEVARSEIGPMAASRSRQRRLVPLEPRPALATKEVSVELDDAFAEEIARWSRSMGLTPASTIQTVWATVLWCCAGRGPGIDYGLIVNGRGVHDRSSIGMFADVTTVRFAAPERKARFGQVVKQMQTAIAGRRDFEAAVVTDPKLEPESAVVVQNIPIRYAGGGSFAGARIEHLEQSITETVPLIFEWRPGPPVGFTVRYDPRLVTRTLVTTITRSLESVIDALAEETTIEDVESVVAAIAADVAISRDEQQAADVLAWRSSAERPDSSS